jgi:hypothetical protein
MNNDMVELNTSVPEEVYMEFRIELIKNRVKTIKEGVSLALQAYVNNSKVDNEK